MGLQGKKEIKPGRHCGVGLLPELFCWHRCDRLLREIYHVSAAIVKGKRAVVCPAWRRRRSPGPNLIQSTLCSRSLWDAIMGVCSHLSHPMEHSSCQLRSRAKPVSGLCVHSNECSSLPDYAEEAVWKGRKLQRPLCLPLPATEQVYCTFHIKCPCPHPTLEVTLPHRELTILVTQKIL